VSFIGTVQGGFPYTAAMSGDINGDGITDRPDLVGPVSYNTRNPLCYVIDSRNANCHASSSAFVNLPAGSTRFGSEGRDTLIGPGLFVADVSAGKNTRFGKDERFNVQFRWEAFNFFNRANYNQPAAVVNVTSPAFGKYYFGCAGTRNAVRNPTGILTRESLLKQSGPRGLSNNFSHRRGTARSSADSSDSGFEELCTVAGCPAQLSPT